MNSYLRRAAVVVLAVALSLPLAAASPERRHRDRDENPVIRVVKKIQKFFGIATNDDLPQPPVPAPPKP